MPPIKIEMDTDIEEHKFGMVEQCQKLLKLDAATEEALVKQYPQPELLLPKVAPKAKGEEKAALEAKFGKKKKRKKGSVVEEDDEPLNPSAEYRNGWEAIRSLQATIGRRYVSTAQVLQVVQRLPSIDLLRVEGIIALFGRIVDLDKFHELWRELTHDEGDELIHRIGYLNAGNTMAMEWGGRV